MKHLHKFIEMNLKIACVHNCYAHDVTLCVWIQACLYGGKHNFTCMFKHLIKHNSYVYKGKL